LNHYRSVRGLEGGVAGRLIVDLSGDGTVTVMADGDGELPSATRPVPLAWPLDDDALEDLRWYLEDYLVAPYGVYEDRGARIAGELDGWGRAAFGAVFGSGPARDAYVRMRVRGAVEFVFRSDAPSLLGLPWELMADPGRDTPLALDTAGVDRSLLMDTDTAETVAVPDERLRVLMVISRPGGIGDVGYRMIARPLLERLEAVRGAVDLVVLRPPTLEALRAELAAAAAAGTPYQVVHFDGHGVMPDRSGGAGGGLTSGGQADEGVLAFEKPGGGADRVSASRVAQVLADAQVPVAVLNACQSGAMGKELEAAVATRLLRAGVASVVAMAYSVYAVAAAEFMAAFYERLFSGGTVSAAVTAGRQQMWHNSGRPSPKGDLPLADWLVPVHYFRREVSFPEAVTPRPVGRGSLEQALEAVTATATQPGAGDLDATGGVFVGRDALFYDLEAAARLHRVVILAGPGGTGKTELAKAFARWWRDTGGVEQPEWVFWHSFEPGLASFGLDGVINKIGRQLYGERFALLETEQRRAVVLDALREHRMLLVWDNFESVRSMPDPGRATPPLDEAGCTALAGFLAAIAAGGRSAVLVTSRTAEDWLGDIRRVRVGGLAVQEAAEYAGILLDPYPAARGRRESRAFSDLMQWLDGHPLSMRLVLPRLASDTPEALLAGLQGTTPLDGEEDVGTGRTRSLAASIAYSYAHLASPTRRLLPAASLFHGIADADVLAIFSGKPGVPKRFAGASREDWAAALDDAARVGLLTGIGSGMYRLHPALPGYLAAAWRPKNPVIRLPVPRLPARC
jgi:CHAT domain